MKKLRKIIPVIAICIIGIMLTVIVKKSGHPLTVDTIIEYTPDNTLLAIVVMLTFFCVKKSYGGSAAFCTIFCMWHDVFAI